ncbi:C6 zinc finger protein [Penicillium hispanicum]|uniref:C6 zinc finger protein n=1 Tax=Penicillium hispanicum TaxID=1080232 RepID=UPI0025407173|nr:C6 zinc finger protein [Penicillium hispanicum]KAJ5591633.1 C6 zinc finger protein [Penicillium hispanicum]
MTEKKVPGRITKPSPSPSPDSKGLQRVRTGCLTCRARKIKCDELHPRCMRCISSGRICAGYADRSQSSPSLPRPPTKDSVDHLDLTVINAWKPNTSPVNSMPMARSSWTEIVSHLGALQPTATHTAISLTSLYEQFRETNLQAHLPYDQFYPTFHSNKAAKELRALGPDQTDAILVTSIMLTCVEFVRNDVEAAIRHMTHGINILNASPTPNIQLARLYRRLSLVPFFTAHYTWELPLVADEATPLPAASFESYEQVHETIDIIAYNTTKLARFRDEYIDSQNRGKSPNIKKWPHFILERQRLCRASLITFAIEFAACRAKRSPRNAREEYLVDLIEMRWLVARMWTDCCLQHPTAYRAYGEDFRRILELGRNNDVRARASGAQASPLSKSPDMLFELGYVPQLYFVVLACRELPVRLEALDLMQRTCQHTREILWDTREMLQTSKTYIEREHGASLEVLREMSQSERAAPAALRHYRLMYFHDRSGSGQSESRCPKLDLKHLLD